MKEKVKKIIKYTLNTLSIVAALIIAINAVEGISIPYTAQITGVISAVNGVLSSCLLGDKAISKSKEKTK